jgi:outer membrane protein assembly factor BamE (lipoprotein component of BamABCDE complex)
MNARKSAVGVIVASVLAVGCTGCLVSAKRSETQSGNYVASSTFDQIEPGQTTASWVAATLGNPTEKTAVDGGSEVWKWTYTERKEGKAAVFLIFGGEDVKESTGHAFVEFKDGVVTKKWRT